jgi:zinc/manganese transport system ATP-binding protein
MLLKELNLSLFPGQCLALVGANGTGKTTLLKSIIGLHDDYTGTIERKHVPIIGYLPQRSALDLNFPILVREVVAMGLWPQWGWLSPLSNHQETSIVQALQAVGMDHAMMSPLNQLSGGQIQRVLFARLMVQNSSVILLDEPFEGIDRQTVLNLTHLIQNWHHLGKCIVAVIHHCENFIHTFPETLVLKTPYWSLQSTSKKFPLCVME